MASKRMFCLLGNSSVVSKSNVPVITVAARSNSSSQSNDKVTHTGQVFEEDDRRLARFVGRPKEVNPNWAIDLIAETPPNPSKDRVVACDGGGGPLGHPKVYINLDKPGNHSCGYCGLRFFKEDHH